jgi:Calcineurin-like phosphoesterase
MAIPLRSPSRQRKPRARVPDGVRVYAIGDIHGRADLLEGLLSRIEAHMAANPSRHSVAVFLGDYIDRGPESRGVLERLVAFNRPKERIFLKGNHEAYLADFLKSPPILKDWQQLGGLETLMSYGLAPPINANAATQVRLAVEFSRAFPDTHRHFLDNLQLSFTCGDFFFVHAGVRPGVPFEKQRDEDLLWIRQEFLHSEYDYGKIVVHGHTPALNPEIRSNRINIDTGAYATGRLTCLILEGQTIDFI